MDLNYSPADDAYRADIRAWLDANLPQALRAKVLDHKRLSRDDYASWHKLLGTRGWSVVAWPKEYGGPGWDATQRHIWDEECARIGAPGVLPFGVSMVAPVIMKYGSDAQKAYYLPRILDGTDWWCQGYSEPGSGSDLASLRTRAERQGDHYVVNGQKTWTTLGQFADMMFCLVRTDTGAKKQEGISFLLIDMKTPGITVRPIITLDEDHEVNEVFLEDVKVPVENLVGEENQGWSLITNQLNHERVALTSAAPIRSALDEVCDWARGTKLASGQRVIDQEWVQLNLARVHAKAEFLKLVNWRIAAQAGQGLGPAAASATKVFGTEFATEAYRLLMEVLGANAYVREGSAGAVLAGRIERMHRSALILTFGGGTNEIQRDLIAIFGLGLPRSLR